MTIEQVEKNISEMIKNFQKESFIFDLLLSYGLPKTTITLLKKGRHNLSKKEGVIFLKKKLYFEEITDNDLHVAIDAVEKNSTIKRHYPRFIIITDYKTLLATDTKTNDRLDISLKELAKHGDFFLPWAGIEKHKYINENIADRKAAEKMAKLYDEIMADNEILDKDKVHDLNVFLVRLLFCFFAEDTKIFNDKIFAASISSHTQEDGSNLHNYLEKLYTVLDTKKENRVDLPFYFEKFPYVNGELFREKCWIPKFTKHSRKIIIECGGLDWSRINPDIFGSMMQAVIHPGERSSLGMHYTSVPNIMKVIEPLFLNELKEEFEKNRESKKGLMNLLSRLHKIKIFDPACGSGNFIIISYKELRRLEMDILKELKSTAYFPSNLKNLYGVEIDDFAHQIAKLSLYIAEHQLNLEFQERFGRVNPTLPLQTCGNIICDNATRIDWEKVCPKKEDDEIYILGNPPYQGGKLQNTDQKSDMDYVFDGFEKYSNLDYVSCWFYKASKYLSSNIKVAFVTTNSISQGTQVNDLWPYVLKNRIEIYFATKDFLWSNNAKHNAGVMCSIIGLRKISDKPKYISTNNFKKRVANINAYLLDAPNIFIEKRTTPLSKLPEMNQGNIPLENGHLRLSGDEKNKIVKEFPESHKLFVKVSGSQELINGIERWCLWISDKNLKLALSIKPIRDRIELVKKFREKGAENAKACLNRPHQFCMLNTAKKNLIVVPIVSSIKREYLPLNFLENDYIIMNSALVIYDSEPYIFGILCSKMHMTWIKAFAGKLKSDLRYSVGLCWYSFPLLPLTTKQKEEITRHVYAVLEEREKHSEKTLAGMYDPDKMPGGLREAHHSLDLAVDRCYRSKPFSSDEERLECLFRLYEQMIADEKNIKNSK